MQQSGNNATLFINTNVGFKSSNRQRRKYFIWNFDIEKNMLLNITRVIIQY